MTLYLRALATNYRGRSCLTHVGTEGLAFNAPLRTRRERAQRVRENRKDFFDRYSPEARQILEELLEKYAEHGNAQFVLPDVLHVPPISKHGTVNEISKTFGGAEKLREAVHDLQNLLYAA